MVVIGRDKEGWVRLKVQGGVGHCSATQVLGLLHPLVLGVNKVQGLH